MKYFYSFSIKRRFRPLMFFIAFFLTHSVANAQCDWFNGYIDEFAIPTTICGPTNVTLTANFYPYMQNGWAWGQLRWYTQETGGQPFHTTDIGTNQFFTSESAQVVAADGLTVYVTYYDNWNQCEAPRTVYYTFTVPQTPTLNWEYSYVCGNVGRIKMTSNIPGTQYSLYKSTNGTFSFVTINSSGIFEIADYDPDALYAVEGSNGGCGTGFYQIWWDYYNADPPAVSGNFSIYTGASTTIYASSQNNYTGYRWYDAQGNFLAEGSSYSTPALTSRKDYRVRGYYEGGCVSDETWVSVLVSQPPVPVTCDDFEIEITRTGDPIALCQSQTVTLTAQYFPSRQNDFANGQLRWYNQAAGGQPFAVDNIGNNIPGAVTSSVNIMANDGATVWVSYVDYWKQNCESPRIPYTFHITPTPVLDYEYAYGCGTVAKFKVTSTTPGIQYYLYKTSGGNYNYVSFNFTGIFEITDYDPTALYAVVGWNEGCATNYFQIVFDNFPVEPPTILGNLNPSPGTTTTLSCGAVVHDIKWFDANDNLLHQGFSYTTPVLGENVYTYKVRAITENEICVSEPAIVTVTVNLPLITYSPLYDNSYNKTIDLSRPVGTVKGEAGTTPEGAATYTIPIFTPPGTNGASPSVSLSYSSMANNGIAGYGWNLNGLSVIGRVGKNNYHNEIVTPVTFTDQDVFILDGNRLNPVSGANGADQTIYAAEVETFGRIKSYGGSTANPDWFEVTNKDGSVMEYGRSADARFLTDDGANVTFWRLNKITDINGNYIEYKYRNGYRDSRIDEINYTGNSSVSLAPYNKIKFNYQVRTDDATSYIGGASFMLKHLLESIAVSNEGTEVKTYLFNYGKDEFCSMLNEVTEKGSDGKLLNSTIFVYSARQATVSILPSTALTGAYDYSYGDFNGDGKTDLVAALREFNQDDGLIYHKKFQVLDQVSEGSYFTLYSKDPLTSGGRLYGGPRGVNNFLTSDYDGDGRDDVVEIYTQRMVSRDLPTRNYLSFVRINLSRTGTNIGELTPSPIDYSYTYAPGNDYKVIEPTNGSFFIGGDFDGDGNQDFITIRGKNLTIDEPECKCYKAFFTSPSTNIFDREITGLGIGSNSADEHYASSIADANFMALDVDGDGKPEVMASTLNRSYIFSIKKTGSGSSATFAASQLFSTIQIGRSSLVYPGDFNGDGKTDLLIREGSWKIMYSTGTNFLLNYFTFNRTVDFSGVDKVVVGDFNGDGKSDICHAYYSASTKSKFSLYYSRGNSNNSFVNEVYECETSLPIGNFNFTTGDFNGDGKSDIFTKATNDATAHFISFSPMAKERLLTKVTNGHLVTNTFEYRALSDKDNYPNVYDRTIPLDDPTNGNGFNYVQLPMYVVSSFTSPNGIGGLSTTRYHYENAVIHRKAKGFLGFRTIVAENATAGTRTTIENQVNTTFAASYVIRQTNQLTNNTLVSVTANMVSFIGLPINSANPKRYTRQTDKIQQFDYVSGIGTETGNGYDAYGNITSSTVKTGAFSQTTITPSHITTTNSVFGAYNTPVPALVTNITESEERVGMPVLSKQTAFTYLTNGLLQTKTEFPGLDKEVKNTYTYDKFGNLETSTMIAKGVANNRVASMTYDTKGRFPISKQQGVAGNKQTETATYDYKWGVPKKQTSSGCLTSSFDYDGFGRLIQTTVPAGYTITNSIKWDIQGQTVYYSATDYPGGKADTRTWFDKLGREIKTETDGFKANQPLTQITTYNAKGLVSTKTNPYLPTETPFVTTNTYDNFNRLQTVSNSLQTVNYGYAKLAGGKLEQTVTAAGQSSRKITDATGKVVTAVDNGGQLSFTYDSWGHQTQVVHGSDVLVVNTYDNFGQQTSTTDKNSGTVTYDYDALGQLKQQTDANGNTYTMAYDDFGRIISRQGPEGPTLFEYYKNLATGCNTNSLSKVTGFKGEVKEFTFDNLNQIQTETVTIDGTINTTQYNYDNYGNVSKITYPSGVVVNNVYNNNGYLTAVTGGDNAAPVNLFTATEMNPYGQYTEYTLGASQNVQKTYTNGVPTRFYTPGIQDLNFTFDYAKGNLMSRQDALKNITETFGYDQLNRLTTTTINNVQQLNIAYDWNNGSSRGNINSKTDAGNYVYKNDKIHAVAYITNPAGPTLSPVTISDKQQEIAYTQFLKPESITENNYRLEYVYDADYERAKSILKQNNAIIETKYYFGNYEKQISGGVTREIHYVSGGDGLCAIIVREGSANNIYFTYKDHLGSLLTVTDVSGNVIAEQNFDAWGRNRNATTWQYGTWTAAPAWLYRGYTGHEHLQQFALINMNGRMYDPIEGRMLSTDNYVPSPFSTQGYNRYSYANNNPLAFVDPDGNSFLAFAAVVGISTAVSAATYSLTAAFHGNWNWKGFAKAAAMGALAGAISGGIAQIPGYTATNLALNMMSNMAAQTGTALVFGNDVNFRMVVGSILGGALAHGFGNYSGVNGGGAFSNIGSELAFNTVKYAATGGISGALMEGFSGGDIGMGFMNGMRNGMIGGLALASVNILTMGRTYVPDPKDLDEKMLDNKGHPPVFRTGTFLTKLIRPNLGLTFGRNLITHNNKRAYNIYLYAHEYKHFLDIIKMGMMKFYSTVHSEYKQYGVSESYGVEGTLENDANKFSGFLNGYYYLETKTSVDLVNAPAMYYKNIQMLYRSMLFW